jgi:hypothetical protein
VRIALLVIHLSIKIANGNDVYINGGKHLADFSNELYAIKEGIVVIKGSYRITESIRVIRIIFKLIFYFKV